MFLWFDHYEGLIFSCWCPPQIVRKSCRVGWHDMRDKGGGEVCLGMFWRWWRASYKLQEKKQLPKREWRVSFNVGEGVKGDEEVMERFDIHQKNNKLWGRLQKKQEHKLTYYSRGRCTQVDHILCRWWKTSARWENMVREQWWFWMYRRLGGWWTEMHM